jgi:hypothetical protein
MTAARPKTGEKAEAKRACWVNGELTRAAVERGNTGHLAVAEIADPDDGSLPLDMAQ